MSSAQPPPTNQILKPQDWAHVEASCLSVLVAGALDGTEQCHLIPRDDWVAGRHAASASDPTATLRHLPPWHWWAYFPNLSGKLGAFIITVVRSDGIILASSGVHLSRSAGTALRFDPVQILDGPVRQLLFPVALLEFAHSGFKRGGRQADVTVLDRPSFFSSSTEDRLTATLLEAEAPFDARHALVLEHCHGTNLQRFQQLADATAWSSSALYFLMVRNGIADLRNGIVLTEDGEAWLDSTVGSLAGDPQAAGLDDYIVADGRLGWMPQGQIPVIPDDRAAFVFLHKASRTNHAHWLMNSLLAVFYALPEILDGRLVLIAPPLPRHMQDVLLGMGVPSTAIYESDAHYVCSRRLVFPSPLSTRANMNPSPSCLPFFQHLKTVFARTYADPMPELVVFTRTGFVSRRVMVNETEMITALRALGFTSVAPHELSMQEEINVLSCARIIVSQLGAALSNMAFAPAGCTIIEVGTDNYTSNEYLHMAHLLEQSYVRVMVEPTAEGFESSGAFRFLAPIDVIVALVSRLLETPPARKMA